MLVSRRVITKSELTLAAREQLTGVSHSLPALASSRPHIPSFLLLWCARRLPFALQTCSASFPILLCLGTHIGYTKCSLAHWLTVGFGQWKAKVSWREAGRGGHCIFPLVSPPSPSLLHSLLPARLPWEDPAFPPKVILPPTFENIY